MTAAGSAPPGEGDRVAAAGPARCRSCGGTRTLLLSWCAPRRAGALEVIGVGLAAVLGGSASRGSVPAWACRPGPACGWLRSARGSCADGRSVSWARAG